MKFACLYVPVWLLSTVQRHPGRVMDGDVKLEFCGCEYEKREEREGFLSVSSVSNYLHSYSSFRVYTTYQ